MDEINKDKLNDTKYLLEDSECKSINLEEYPNFKNNNLNNTQLLLEDKPSILYDIQNNNNNIKNKEDNLNNNIPDNNINNDSKHIIDNSIKEIINTHNINIEKEKAKDEQEIIKQQNILLNNQSSHLEELFSLSYTDLSHNIPSLKIPQSYKNKNIINNNNINKNINNNINININNSLNKDIDKSKEEINKIYFGLLFPTEQKIKNINYKNNDKKKIICFKIRNNNNQNCENFKLLIDNNKNYFILKSNEEINIKILLEIPFMKKKSQINCELDIIDINNTLIETFFLYANVDIPKLCCLTYKNMLKNCNIPLIRINVNCEENQRFKIPLKNLSLRDISIDFYLLSSPNKDDNIKKYIDYEIFFDRHNNFIIPSFDVNFLELIINIKKNNEFDFNNCNNYIIIKKILRANIFETKINYYFCVEFIVITENLNNCGDVVDNN